MLLAIFLAHFCYGALGTFLAQHIMNVAADYRAKRRLSRRGITNTFDGRVACAMLLQLVAVAAGYLIGYILIIVLSFYALVYVP